MWVWPRGAVQALELYLQLAGLNGKLPIPAVSSSTQAPKQSRGGRLCLQTLGCALFSAAFDRKNGLKWHLFSRPTSGAFLLWRLLALPATILVRGSSCVERGAAPAVMGSYFAQSL